MFQVKIENSQINIFTKIKTLVLKGFYDIYNCVATNIFKRWHVDTISA
jgi:hypothetical protein